jgi:uncharacterized protein involved in exopolysaccharide biosynthesis
MKEYSGFSTRDLLNILYRRILVLKFLVVMFPVAVLVACLVMTPVYESTAKLMVTAKRENTALLQGPSDQGLSSYVNLNVDEIDLNSEMELLTSLDLWTRTVQAVGLTNLRKTGKGYLSRWKARLSASFSEWFGKKPQGSGQDISASEAKEISEMAESLIKMVKVVPFPKSRVIDISVKYYDPEMTHKILTTLLDLYIPYHLEVYSTPGAQQFFSELGKKYYEEFNSADQRLGEFKKKWSISSPEKQKSELIALISQLEDALLGLHANQNQYQNMLESLDAGVIPTGQLTPSKDRGSENTVVAVIATQLLRAQQKKLQTDQYFTRGSRDARVSDESVRELTKTLRESITSEMEVIKAKTASLDEGLKSKQAQLKVLEEKSEESRKLELAAMIAKERYLQYVSKEEEARLENLKRSDRLINVSVVAKPFIPGSPAFPKTFLFVLGAFFLAFPLGIGTILVLNFFDHSFNHPKEVEAATGYPVLAVLTKLTRPGVEGSTQ